MPSGPRLRKLIPRRGNFRDVRADELSAGLMQALVERTGIDPQLVEDVCWGRVQQQGEQGFDVARIAAMMAGLPIETGGVTITAICMSSLQAINDRAMATAAGCEDADRWRHRTHGAHSGQQGL